MGLLEKIGSTPLLEIEGIYVKLECSNPGGSVKDRIARFILERALERGELKPGETVVEATSGNTGIALSMVARELGLEVLIFMPEQMSRERRNMLEALGAEVRLTPRQEGFEGPIRRRDAFRGREGYYVPDQFANPENTLCHRLETGAEIVAQLASLDCAHIDWFVAGVGTGGTLMGVGRALKEALPGVRMAAVEPSESAVMSGRPPGDHGIQGIGDGFIPELVKMEEVDAVLCVSTREAEAASRAIRENHGYCVGLSSGANMLAARRLAAEGSSVLTLWPDCADRYLSVGLAGPASREVTCPLHATCAARAEEWMGPPSE